MKYDQITIDRINTFHPNYRELLKELYLEANNKLLPKGWRLRFTHVYRSNAEQDKLFNQRPKVTNAKGGQSIHNYGLAFDIVLLRDKDNNGTFESVSWEVDKYWKAVAAFFKSKGFTWGGDWKFYDAPHFELSKGRTWRDFQAMKMYKKDGLTYPILPDDFK